MNILVEFQSERFLFFWVEGSGSDPSEFIDLVSLESARNRHKGFVKERRR
jgi:hypothetical protein